MVSVGLESTDIPQADRLESITAHVQRVALDLGTASATADRQVDYLAAAARVLGWFGRGQRITEAGAGVARALAGPETTAYWLASFERARVCAAWKEHAGVSELGELPPESAEPFLLATGLFAEATARRRARTLDAWLGALTPALEAPPPSLDRIRRYLNSEALPPHAVRFIAEPIDDRLPTRMGNWARRNDILTFGQLLARPPSAILSERNLGERSVRQTDEVIVRTTGLTWSRIRELWHGPSQAAPGGAAAADAPSLPRQPIAATDQSWDGLKRRCPPELAALSIDRVPLPVRMVNFVARQDEVIALGDLLEWEEARLKKVKNLGRKTIRDSRQNIDELIESVAPSGLGGSSETRKSLAMVLEDLPDLLTHVKARVANLDQMDRLVWRRRAGLHGATSTLQEVGEMLGVSRERARQLEKRAAATLASEWWVPLVKERLSNLVGEDAIPLADLGDADEFFAGASEQPVLFDYLLRRILESEIYLLAIGSEKILAAADPKETRDALAKMRTEAKRIEFPVTWVAAMELAQAHAAFAPSLAPYFEQELGSHLARTTDPNGIELAVGYGWGLEARVLQFLEASPGPVTRDELEQAVGRWGNLPDQVILVARGVVALPKHVPNFDVWSRRLVPLAKNIMRQEDPSRQWAVPELLEAISEQAQLPEWFGHWHLASMLRLSGEVRYLGRLQVALDHEDAPEERRQLHDILLELLEKPGAPVPTEQLVERLREVRGASEAAVHTTFLSPPFFEVAPGLMGLAPRDVPGGAEALAAALTAVESELEKQQRGLGSAEARTLIAELSPAHEKWTVSMVKSLIRSQETMRLNRSGGIGLADWEDDRLPTRRQVVATMVAEAQGRLAIDTACDQVEAVFGTRPGRVQLANLVHPDGLHVRDRYLVTEDELLSETAAPPDLPDPVDIPDFPRPAVPIFRELLRESDRDLVVLRRESLAYVAEFEEAARSQPHIDPAEAHAAAAAVAKLIDTLPESAEKREKALVQAAARYFLLSEDAESDFAVGGLDDDIEVIDSVASFLGRSQCRVQLPKVEHRPKWYSELPDEGTRRVFEHLFAHGVVTESEAAYMLGSQRAARRFARRLEQLSGLVPFSVQIDVVGGMKRYVRQER